MTLRTSFFALSLVAAVAGCNKKPADKAGEGSGSGGIKVTATTGSGSGSGSGSAAAPATGSGSAAAATGGGAVPPGFNVKANFEGREIKFTGVQVHTGSQTEDIELTTNPKPGCDGDYKTGDVLFGMSLERGPGGKHFAGKPTATYATISQEDEKQKFKTGMVVGTITIDPSSEWKEGGKVRGTINFNDTYKSYDDGDKVFTYTVTGTFEAPVCSVASDDLAYQATPETATGPLTANVADAKFAFKSGVGILSQAADGQNYIREINLYDADVTCENYGDAKGNKVNIYGPTGSIEKSKLIGSPTKGGNVTYTLGGNKTQDYGPTWVNWSALDLKEGGEAKGSFYGESSKSAVKEGKPAAKISGEFTVKLCN